MATAATEFKVGDTVVLKAGGPVMTVHSVPERFQTGYQCQWFAGKKLERGHFMFEELKAAEPPQPIPAPTNVSPAA